MLHNRVIPVLLLDGGGLVKTRQFKDPRYVGDPINAVRIFNEKEVDELVFLDISKDRRDRGPNFSLLKDIAEEAFMPFAYGGGISSMSQVERLFALGVEKVVLNTSAAGNPELVSDVAKAAGSSSVVVSVDVRSNWMGRFSVWTNSGGIDLERDPVGYCEEMQVRGAGEIILGDISRDGVRKGYNLPLIEAVSQKIDIPVVALGGAGELADFRNAVRSGASAVAAGSIFTFHGKHRAVLITYPEYQTLVELLK